MTRPHDLGDASSAADSEEHRSGMDRRSLLKGAVAAGVGVAAWSAPSITSLGGTPVYAAACTGNYRRFEISNRNTSADCCASGPVEKKMLAYKLFKTPCPGGDAAPPGKLAELVERRPAISSATPGIGDGWGPTATAYSPIDDFGGTTDNSAAGCPDPTNPLIRVYPEGGDTSGTGVPGSPSFTDCNGGIGTAGVLVTPPEEFLNFFFRVRITFSKNDCDRAGSIPDIKTGSLQFTGSALFLPLPAISAKLFNSITATFLRVAVEISEDDACFPD